MTAGIFIALALTSSPTPAANYYAEISPQITAEIQNCIINDEYRQHIDFNGDGNLTIADAVGVAKRYQDNMSYGNSITVDSEVIHSIATENYPDDLIYYEIDFVNGELTERQYEITVSDVTEISIYFEFSETSETIHVIADPFTESVTVMENQEATDSL